MGKKEYKWRIHSLGYSEEELANFKEVTQEEFADYVNKYPNSYDMGCSKISTNFSGNMPPGIEYYDLKTEEVFAIFVYTGSEIYEEGCFWFIKI